MPMPARRTRVRAVALLIGALAVAQLVEWLAPKHNIATPCTAAVAPWQLRKKADPEADREAWRCSEDSEPIREVLHVGLRIQKMYDHWIGPANLDRQDLRLSGFENYAIISAVLLQVLVGFYSGVAQPEDEEKRRTDKLVFEIQMFLLLVATMCATFTMVMFLLAKICNVTALGMYKDVSYATFLQITRWHRVMAFWSLFTGLATFVLAFAVDVFRRVTGERGIALKVMTIAGGLFMLYQWADVLLLADKHIFKSQ